MQKMCTFASSNHNQILQMKQIQMLITVAFMATMMVACGEKEDVIQPTDPTDSVVEVKDNIYQFKVLDGNGDSVSLANYEGMVILVVNTATECGYTLQYTDLQNLYETYQDSGFVILDFPCNQFGGQAPGSYDDIHNFCTGTYNITFPQFAKINVNGNDASPLYVWLKEKKPSNIQWNFTKFLIDREGNVVRRYEPNTNMIMVESGIKNQL